MKRFAFRLDAVLRVRQIREDVARAEALRANLALGAADALVAERHARYESLARPAGPLSYDAHTRLMWSLGQAAAGTSFASARRATAAADADAARDTWAEHHRGLRVIERLHDRALAAHRAGARREEDRLADELALVRHQTGRHSR